MRIDHWYAHPTNRRLANRVGGAGTVIAAISAGLIAGLSAHPTENPILASHRVSDAALDSTTPEHQQATTPTTTANPQQVGAVQPAQAPPPAPSAFPAASGNGGDRDARGTPVAVPTSVPPTPPEQSGSTFQPYVHNGTATQTTTGPSGTATITTTPTTNTTRNSEHSTAAHTSTSSTPEVKSTKDHHHDSSTGDDHNNCADQGAGSDRTQSDSRDGGNQHSGSTAYSPTAGPGSVPQQGGGSTDSGSASRVAQALPPGFTPSAPRQSPPTGTSSAPSQALPPTTPTGSSTPGSAPAPSTNAAPTSGIGDATPSSTQYQPAQFGPALSGTTAGPGTVSSPGTAPVTPLTPVACPAAVANATCYQQLPAPSTSSPGTGGTVTTPGSAQGSTSSVPTINPAPPIPMPNANAPTTLPNAAAPAALPNAGSARAPVSSPSRSVSSGDCQASSNNTDSSVPVRGWEDFSAWLWGRVQDCINQGMAGSGSGFNSGASSSAGSSSATSTSSKPAKDSSGTKGSAGSKHSKKDDD